MPFVAPSPRPSSSMPAEGGLSEAPRFFLSRRLVRHSLGEGGSSAGAGRSRRISLAVAFAFRTAGILPASLLLPSPFVALLFSIRVRSDARSGHTT
jgi:hypothetical protein